MKQTQYPYIRAWGLLMGSMEYYIKAQIEKAKKDNAPQTAIYHREHNPENNGWYTIEDVTAEDVRLSLENFVNRMK